jgi:hypothetical protein
MDVNVWKSLSVAKDFIQGHFDQFGAVEVEGFQGFLISEFLVVFISYEVVVSRFFHSHNTRSANERTVGVVRVSGERLDELVVTVG